MNPYRKRIWRQFEDVLTPLAPLDSALDFGSGDGWFARQMIDNNLVSALSAVDVQLRARTFFAPQLFDGVHLPFEDNRFDLVYCVDVLHHCPSPKDQLREAARVCNRYFLIKDHTYKTALGKTTLCALDELGNRRFGVPSLYHYQKRWEWFKVLQSAGFRLRHSIHPAPCHEGILGRATNALQFIALWEKK